MSPFMLKDCCLDVVDQYVAMLQLQAIQLMILEAEDHMVIYWTRFGGLLDQDRLLSCSRTRNDTI